MFGRLAWSNVLGMFSPETRAQLERLYATVKGAELERLRGDVRAFVASDPIHGHVLAAGIVKDALSRHGVNLTTLALDILVRWLAQE